MPTVVPESCLLIFVGLIMRGLIYSLSDKSPPVMDSDIFFLYLLPPIVLDAGYFMLIGTLLLYAVVEAMWNAFRIGLSLYDICQVVYKLFKSFCEMPSIKPVVILAEIGKFLFLVGIGGIFIGLLFGTVSAFTVSFTKTIWVIEPLFVFLYSYLPYLTPEMFHLSGIVA